MLNEKKVQENERSMAMSLTYDQWRDKCNRILAQYIYRRYVLEKEGDFSEEEDGDMLDTDSDTDSDTDNDNDATPEDDTQPSQQREPESQAQAEDWIADGKNKEKKKPRPKIPLVQNTQHVATSVSQMDLYTKTLHLPLCKVEKVFSKRHTKRMAGYISSATIRPSSPRSTLLPLTSFGSHHDDGPLFSAYKHVLTMEVTQLQDPDATILRDTAASAVPDSKLYRRLSVFFYNTYAKAVNAFVTDNRNCQFYIKLEHIPAASIFPYKRDKLSWFDQDLCPYVLCIGNRSNIRTDSMTSGRLTFEADDMVIRILAQPNQLKATGDEAMVKKGVECTIDVTSGASYEKSDEGLVQAALDDWKTKHHMEALRRANVVTTRREQYEEATTSQANATGRTNTSPVGQKRAAVSESTCAKQHEADAANERTRFTAEEVVEPPSKRAKGGATTSEPQESNEQQQSPSNRATLSNLGYDKLKDIFDIYTTHRNTPPEAQTSKFPSTTVVAVILGFNQPARTKTNQWMLSVAVVDQSLPECNDEDDILHVMNVNIFRKNREDLPKLHKVGDLLRLHDAGIQRHNGDLQLLGRLTCKTHVIRREPTHFHFDGEDINFGLDETDLFTSLWEWGQARLSLKFTMKRALRFKLSQGAYIEKPGDSTVMVCGMYETTLLSNHQQFPCGFIRVWDGTGPPMSDPLPDESEAALATIVNGDPPREALIALHSTVEELNSSSHRTESTKKLIEIVSLCGCVVNIAVWESPHWEFVKQHFKIGDFMRLRNVGKGCLDNGVICLMALVKSWLVPIPRGTLEVREMLEEHQIRLERNEATNSNSALLPIHFSDPSLNGRMVSTQPGVANANATELPENNGISETAGDKRTTSKEVAQHTLEDCAGGEGKYECQFSVVKLLPHCGGNLSKLCKSRKGKAKYHFAATLLDATKSVTALVVGNAGDGLFGVTATNASSVSHAVGIGLISNICAAGQLWKGTIECRIHEEENYFFIKSVETV